MFKYKKVRRFSSNLIGSFGDTKACRKYDDETGLNLYEF